MIISRKKGIKKKLHLFDTRRAQNLSFSLLFKGHANKEEVIKYPRAEVAVTGVV